MVRWDDDDVEDDDDYDYGDYGDDVSVRRQTHAFMPPRDDMGWLAAAILTDICRWATCRNAVAWCLRMLDFWDALYASWTLM